MGLYTCNGCIVAAKIDQLNKEINVKITLESGEVRDVPLTVNVRGLRLADIEFSMKDLIEFQNLPTILKEFWLRSLKNALTPEARHRIGV